MIRAALTLAAAMPLGAFAQDAAPPATVTAAPAAVAIELRSPDGRNAVAITLDTMGRPTYAITRGGSAVIALSPIVLELADDRIGYGMSVTGSERRSNNIRYPIVVGKAREGRDHYSELTVHFAETTGQRRRMDVIVRAYDDGVAFRTVLPVQAATEATVVRGEQTNFNFPAAYKCWGFNPGRFRNSHEGEFDPVDVTRTREHNLFDVPFLCETGKAAFAIAESDLVDFAGMYLTGRADGGLGLTTRLSPSIDDPRVAVRTRVGSPIRTPWRVVMLADRAGELAESTLVNTLAAPSRIADTGWIRPGKSAWDWWNGPSIAAAPQPGTNTATTRAFIDFAAAQGIEYMMIDEGWYVGAGGGALVKPGVDVTRAASSIDLKGVIDYARSKKVGVWLWLNWIALDDQMEDALALYEKLGVAGVKVDVMDRDDQAIVAWYTKFLAAAARHKLMVNLHGAYAPRGLNRTWPNFVTQEGVLGAEYNKWSARITAGHNVMLAYTRNLLGPMDYTPGGFRNASPDSFQIRSVLPFVQTTRAHGLALYVVYDSPVAMVSDSPDTYAASPDGLDFVRTVPTSWDETRFVAGDVGDYIAVARRKGRTWYIGTLNNATARNVRLPLAFLGKGRFDAAMIGDGAAPTAIVRSRKAVGADDVIDLSLAGSGGAVVTLTPR